ncbi:MAG: riboflavin synthase [Rickettsiales bacterium]
MFTGLVQDQGIITRIAHDGDTAITIAPKAKRFVYGLGDSISCNGICLTVSEHTASDFTVVLSAETMRVTTAESWRKGDVINLEPSLALGDKLGGHLVSGHVDAVTDAIHSEAWGDSREWTFHIPAPLAKFIAPKGSITIDGVSLTVNRVTDDMFSVMIIPHTWSVTRFATLQPGDKVNLEIDMLARYVARQLELRA